MHKLISTVLFIVISTISVQAQVEGTETLEGKETPHKLLKQLQQSLPDTNRVRLQLHLGSYYLFKPGAFKNDQDSAFLFFNRALWLSDSLHSIKLHNETLLLKGDCYLEGERLEPGTACFMEVIDYYHKKGDKKNEIAVWHRFGDCITDKNDVFIDKKVSCYEHARNLYRQLKDTLHETDLLKDEADAHLYANRIDLAETELKQVLAQYQAIHYKNLHYTYDLLAAASALKGDMGQELFYRIETVKSMEATEDMLHAPTAYYKLARTYYESGMIDKPLFIKGIAYCKKIKNNSVLNLFVALYARILMNQNKNLEALRFVKANINSLNPSQSDESLISDSMYGDIYQAMKKYDLAEKYYLKMVRYADQRNLDGPGWSQRRIYYYPLIVQFYIKTKQFVKAEHYMKIMAGFPKYGVSMINLANMAFLQFKVDSAAGLTLAAIKDFELNKNINDSLFNATKSKQIAEMQIKYETGQKEKDLQLQQKDIQILKKQSQLDKEQVIKTRTTRNILIGGTCILLLFLGVVYNRYRLKQRSNVLLQEQKVEITGKNTILEGLLQDNKWLMRELHHRVKNNMQMVMSLLSSQAAYLKDEVAIKTVTESQHRIQAMSLIHQKLYKTNNVSDIYMPEYIYELVDYLKESFKQEKLIYFDLEIDPLFLDVLQAVPIGLILNEAITNAMKYAFPFSREGNITVRLNKLEDREILLSISDNGQGLPENFKIDQSNTFGMILINGLTLDLGGKCTITGHMGTTVSILFPESIIAFQKEHKQPENATR